MENLIEHTFESILSCSLYNRKKGYCEYLSTVINERITFGFIVQGCTGQCYWWKLRLLSQPVHIPPQIEINPDAHVCMVDVCAFQPDD